MVGTMQVRALLEEAMLVGAMLVRAMPVGLPLVRVMLVVHPTMSCGFETAWYDK